MANIIKDKFAYIDTFGSDVTIVSGRTRAKILAITVYSGGSTAEYARFKNGDGEPVALCGGLADVVAHFTPAKVLTVFGLVFDDTGSTLESGDFIIVHLA